MSKICVCDMCGKHFSDILMVNNESEIKAKMRWNVKISALEFGIPREYDFCQSCFDNIKEYIKENKHE